MKKPDKEINKLGWTEYSLAFHKASWIKAEGFNMTTVWKG